MKKWIFIVFLLLPFLGKAQSYVWTVAGTGTGGYSGDGGPATAAELSAGEGIWLDAAGNVYLSDMGNNRIRKVTASTGIITTIGGNGKGGYSGDGGPATTAEINTPYGLGADAAGNCFFADRSNNAIRRIDAVTGIITTVAGTGGSGYSGDGGPATAAQVNTPMCVYVDNSTGDLYITADGRIRKVTASTGIITTIAGSSSGGYSGDGGPATAAQLDSWAAGMVMAPLGNLYFSDRFNNRIREINATTGIITTVAGDGSCCYSGDGGPATAAEINGPIGLDLDLAGNIIISDNQNNLIRVVTASTGIINTIAGGGSSTAEGAPALSSFIHPEFICLKKACSGDLYLSNWVENNQIRRVTNVGAGSSGIPDTGYIINDSCFAISGGVLTAPTGFSSYFWDDSSTYSTRTVSNAGKYYVYCISCDSVLVDSFNVLISDTTYSVNDTSICSIVGSITLNATPGYSSYLWNTGSTTDTIKAAGSGIFWVYNQNYCNTLLIDTFKVALIMADTTHYTHDTSVCATIGSVQLSATPGYLSYLWNTGNTTDTMTVSKTGIFWVYNETNCATLIDTFKVALITADTTHDTRDTSVCATVSSITLSAASGYSSYLWGNGNTTESITVNKPGDYWVYNENNCNTRMDTFKVSFTIPDTARQTHDTTACIFAGSITLTATAGYLSYLWNTGSSANTITVSNGGAYWVSASGSCSALIDTYNVKFVPPDTSYIFNDTSVCVGTDSFSIVAPGGYASYLWNNNSAAQFQTINSKGTYWVCCSNLSCSTPVLIDTFHINFVTTDVIANFTFTLPQLNSPITFTNLSENATRYLWNFGDGSTGTDENPVHTYNKTATWNVCLQAFGSGVCYSQICKQVSTDIEPVVGVPSGFSPNGDGQNDVLCVRGSAIQELDLKIFNRWGQMVFETNTQSIGWDGTFNGQPQPVDVYSYVLLITFLNGTSQTKTGNVTLVR